MVTGDPQSQDTRQRLVIAAGEVFAEQGFRAATIRDICARAEANIAAVNYHFGDKERLYAEVLKYGYQAAQKKFPSDGGLGPGAPATDRAAAFIRAMLRRLMDEQRESWCGRLIFREMMEPTDALGELVKTGIQPEFARLREIVRALLGKTAPEEQVLQCVWSITGQCLFYFHAKHTIARIRPGGGYTSADADRLAMHITIFSLAAIECMAYVNRQEEEGT